MLAGEGLSINRTKAACGRGWGSGMPRARGRAFGDLTGSVWDFGFYFKYENPGGEG